MAGVLIGPRRMHPMLFAAKRAYQSVLYRVAYKIARPFGLTPARIDLLYCLVERRMGGGKLLMQSELRRALGVSRTVISRMVIALEELGLVRRRGAEGDRRTKVVVLTAEGLARMRAVMAEVMGVGWLQWALESAVARPPGYGATARTARIVHMLTIRLRGAATALGDYATLRYDRPHPASATPSSDLLTIPDPDEDSHWDTAVPWGDDPAPPSEPALSNDLAE